MWNRGKGGSIHVDAHAQRPHAHPQGEDPQFDDDDLPMTESVQRVVKAPVPYILPDVVSHATRYPGELSRLYARGQLDVRDGRLVASTVEATPTRVFPTWKQSGSMVDVHSSWLDPVSPLRRSLQGCS